MSVKRFRRLKTAIALLPAVAVLAAAAPAVAYDTGPHAEITADAMTAEGFRGDAVGVAQVNNWFPDLYEQAKKNPFSGHSVLERLLAGAIKTERWSHKLVDAAERSHFDSSTSTLFNSAGVTAEWDRLRRAVWTLVQEARAEDDEAKLLTVLGMSLHQVQDFYTHTNWIEPESGLGAEGPGWQARRLGSSPTWFDVPAATRDSVTIYTANTQGHARQHGDWNGDENESLTTTMSKDWPGRPFYLQSAIASHFASRQWVQAVRSWVADDAFWARAQGYRANQRHLEHDLRGAHEVSLYGGHWQGQGEPIFAERGPGGSLINLREAVKNYFQPRPALGRLRGRTEYRKRFESLIKRMADPNPRGVLGPVPSSQEMQRGARIVVLRVLNMRERGLGDPGPDDADMYARARIAGQPMTSAVIHGHDRFSFPDPHEPFTWFKAVPAVPDEGEPVESVEVEVRTADVRSAGTDDDVYLRLGRDLRFPLDKRLYDDFERGDRDTYSVPIDDAAMAGMRVGDITRVQIEKSRDGRSGAWRLGGVTLRVNRRELYRNPRIDRWLEKSRRDWTAPDFTPRAPRGPKVPVWLRLNEDDFLYGGDDYGDINPDDRRRTVSVGYAPGPPLQRTTTGGGRLGGRLDDGEEATITYRLETITPEPMLFVEPSPADPTPDPEPTPVPPQSKPDLVVTGFTYTGVTVKNQGAGAASRFRLRAGNASREIFESFSGLAPGASETRTLAALSCFENYVATVDDLNQVPETDETNNSKPVEPSIC